LSNAPLLELQTEETLEVEEIRSGEVVFVPWRRVPNFAHSSHFDRHFTLDTATGEIRFGPAIRRQDGVVYQHGRIPEAGRAIRFTQYRYGGGVAGNIPVGRLQVLKAALPYIDRVTNLIRAEGGRDAETLAEAKMRAPEEIRAQQRAVTAEDYEYLALGTSRTVARVKCNTPCYKSGGNVPLGSVELLVVPAAGEALWAGDLSRLALEPELRRAIGAHLDQYRLLTTSLVIREPKYLGIKVEADIIADEYSQAEVVVTRVVEALRAFLNPLPLEGGTGYLNGILDPAWQGWPFGRNLYEAEIGSLIHKVPGVKHVVEVKLSSRPVIPLEENLPQLATEAVSEKLLTPLAKKVIEVGPSTLVCSLNHQIRAITL
jgi:predicted phage baseplate assembly protein